MIEASAAGNVLAAEACLDLGARAAACGQDERTARMAAEAGHHAAAVRLLAGAEQAQQGLAPLATHLSVRQGDVVGVHTGTNDRVR